MILNWQRHLKFPLTPRVSPEAINLLQSLLCEPEHRIGSRGAASVLRTNSILAQNRMSAYGLGTVSRSIDGADLIKVSKTLLLRRVLIIKPVSLTRGSMELTGTTFIM